VFKTLYQPISSQADVSIQSPGEVNRQLRQRQIPILNRVRPALGRLEYTGVEQLEQAVLVGEAALGFGQLPLRQDSCPLNRYAAGGKELMHGKVFTGLQGQSGGALAAA